MSRKFGRNYELRIQTDTNTVLTIRLPFTIEFDIIRNTLTSANVCQIRLYNLSKANRNRIRKNVMDFGNYKSIQLKAGYGDNLTTIFQGNISQAWSVREGVDFITQIECFDGGFAFVNGTTNISFPAGTPDRTKIQTMMLNLPNVSPGVVGNYTGVSTRGNAYSGSTYDILGQLTGGGFFVDNEVAHAVQTSETIPAPGGIAIINSQSGLLGTPVLEVSTVRFDMLFEPRLVPGQQVLLDVSTEENFNGLYKITGVKHRGMISESVGASVITTGEFFFIGLLTQVF